MSAIGLTGSEPVAPGPEEGAFLLLVKPAEELLESRIGLDLLDRVERVPQFVVTPGLVNEVFAGVAGRHDFGPAFAARDNMVPSRGELSLTEHASLGHTAVLNLLVEHSEQAPTQKWRKKWESPPRQAVACSRFQDGVLAYAGLLPGLAEGARFALAMVLPTLAFRASSSAIRTPSSHEIEEPLAGLFHQLTPSAFKNRNSGRKGLSRSIYFAFRGRNGMRVR